MLVLDFSLYILFLDTVKVSEGKIWETQLTEGALDHPCCSLAMGTQGNTFSGTIVSEEGNKCMGRGGDGQLIKGWL